MENTARVTLSTFGAIVGIAGLEHGTGEILQGNIVPNGFVIESWPDVKAYEILAGEPAMTIIPNLLLSGILTVLVSIMLIVWAVIYIQRKDWGRNLILLSFVLLLVGGGFGPPIMGFILGVIRTRMTSSSEWILNRDILARLWPILFPVGVIAYLSLWPGMVILSQFVLAESLPVMQLTIFSFMALVLAILSGYAHDSKYRNKVSNELLYKNETGEFNHPFLFL